MKMLQKCSILLTVAVVTYLRSKIIVVVSGRRRRRGQLLLQSVRTVHAWTENESDNFSSGYTFWLFTHFTFYYYYCSV